MSKYASMEDFATKMDWEGGLDSLLYYGLSPDDFPDDMPDDLKEELRAIIEIHPKFESVECRILELGGY